MSARRLARDLLAVAAYDAARARVPVDEAIYLVAVEAGCGVKTAARVTGTPRRAVRAAIAAIEERRECPRHDAALTQTVRRLLV